MFLQKQLLCTIRYTQSGNTWAIHEIVNIDKKWGVWITFQISMYCKIRLDTTRLASEGILQDKNTHWQCGLPTDIGLKWKYTNVTHFLKSSCSLHELYSSSMVKSRWWRSGARGRAVQISKTRKECEEGFKYPRFVGNVKSGSNSQAPRGMCLLVRDEGKLHGRRVYSWRKVRSALRTEVRRNRSVPNNMCDVFPSVGSVFASRGNAADGCGAT